MYLQSDQNIANMEEEVNDDFRRVQEESRRFSEQVPWAERGSRIDPQQRERVRNELQRELERREILSRGSSDGNNAWSSIELGDQSNPDTNYSMYENVDGQTFKDMFEIARSYTSNGELVDIHPVETTEGTIGYNECQNFLSGDSRKTIKINIVFTFDI